MIIVFFLMTLSEKISKGYPVNISFFERLFSDGVQMINRIRNCDGKCKFWEKEIIFIARGFGYALILFTDAKSLTICFSLPGHLGMADLKNENLKQYDLQFFGKLVNSVFVNDYFIFSSTITK